MNYGWGSWRPEHNPPAEPMHICPTYAQARRRWFAKEFGLDVETCIRWMESQPGYGIYGKCQCSPECVEHSRKMETQRK